MRLMASWIMPYQSVQDAQCGAQAKCRVRIYEHEDDPTGASSVEPLILITELADSEGESIALSAEIVVGKLLGALHEVVDLSDRRAPTFVFHYPLESTKAAEYYELVTFEDLSVEDLIIDSEGLLYRTSDDPAARVMPTVGAASFTPLDSEMVKGLLEDPAGR